MGDETSDNDSPIHYLGILMQRLDEIEGILRDVRNVQDRIQQRQQKLDERVALCEAKSGLK